MPNFINIRTRHNKSQPNGIYMQILVRPTAIENYEKMDKQCLIII